VGVNVTEQLDTSLFSEMEQEPGEKSPGWLAENFAVPVAVIGLPGLMSITVTVHVMCLPTLNGDMQDNVVETPRVVTVSWVFALLATWTLSPA